jgi:hypothetical protein
MDMGLILNPISQLLDAGCDCLIPPRVCCLQSTRSNFDVPQFPQQFLLFLGHGSKMAVLR